MTIETKREVLDKLAECYAEVYDAYTDETGSPYYCDDEPNYLDEYDKALPDDLPVIPKAVGDAIKIHKEYAHSILDIFGALSIYGVSRTEPAVDYNAWIVHHPDTFARAWLLGVWRVEETGEILKLEEEK